MSRMSMRQEPFVAVAAFCVDARQNGDGTLSLDRIIDRVTIKPSTPRPWIAPLTAVVALRCSPENGTHTLALQVREPDKAGTRPLLSMPIETTVGTPSIARILRFEFELGGLGSYWFEVFWNGQHVSSILLTAQTAGAT